MKVETVTVKFNLLVPLFNRLEERAEKMAMTPDDLAARLVTDWLMAGL